MNCWVIVLKVWFVGKVGSALGDRLPKCPSLWVRIGEVSTHCSWLCYEFAPSAKHQFGLHCMQSICCSVLGWLSCCTAGWKNLVFAGVREYPKNEPDGLLSNALRLGKDSTEPSCQTNPWVLSHANPLSPASRGHHDRNRSLGLFSAAIAIHSAAPQYGCIPYP